MQISRESDPSNHVRPKAFASPSPHVALSCTRAYAVLCLPERCAARARCPCGTAPSFESSDALIGFRVIIDRPGRARGGNACCCSLRNVVPVWKEAARPRGARQDHQGGAGEARRQRLQKDCCGAPSFLYSTGSETRTRTHGTLTRGGGRGRDGAGGGARRFAGG